MTVRAMVAADEAKVLACGANAAWPRPVAWDHTTWLAYFARPENICLLDEAQNGNVRGIIAVTLRTLTEVDPLTDVTTDTTYARLVVLAVSGSLGLKARRLEGAALLIRALQACQQQGATVFRAGFDGDAFSDALQAAGVTLTLRPLVGPVAGTVLDCERNIADMLTKLGAVT